MGHFHNFSRCLLQPFVSNDVFRSVIASVQKCPNKQVPLMAIYLYCCLQINVRLMPCCGLADFLYSCFQVVPLFYILLVFLIQTILKSKQSAAPGSSTFLLSDLDTRLRETLSEWFTPQLMELQHITWESPCDILEKISDYEAVHRLRHWKDLKHRVGPNRRCFIFTHKAIPREPIVVLHVALTSQPSSSIQV